MTPAPFPFQPPPFAPRGMALVAVLWMSAALALLVAGLLAVSRAEVRAAQLRGAIAEASALGDAAIQLAVLEWRTASQHPERLARTVYRFDGRSVDVRAVPATGYINLNTAPESLLRAMLAYGAGVDLPTAETLAQRIVDWRDADETALPNGAEAPAYAAAGLRWRPRNGRLVTLEDLLQVIGMDVELFERLRPLVTLWSGKVGGVNPLAAPPEVLPVLTAGDLRQTQRIASARDAGSSTIDTTALEQAHLAPGSLNNVLHVEARVTAEDGHRLVRGRWIVLVSDENGAPWRTVAADPVRFLPPDSTW